MDSNNTLRQPSPSSGLAIFLIVIGTLTAIWGGVWWYALRDAADATPRTPDWQNYVCTGVFLSGIALTVIGVLVGRIGQEAQNADVPVGQVTAAAVQPEGMAPAAPAQPAAAPVQQVAAAPAQPAAPPQPPARR